MRSGYRLERHAASAGRPGTEMHFGARRFTTREEFLKGFRSPWMLELRAVLRELLDKDRRTFSVGAGECEHEVALAQEGYRLEGSDYLPEALEPVRRLFPEFPCRTFDVFHPEPVECDDVLVTGMDAYFDDAELLRVLSNLKGLLPPGGRLIFVLRCHDTWFTRFCDRLAFPALAFLFNRLRGGGWGLSRRGYRRTPGELRRLAEQAGFRVGSVRWAGFGVELTRLYLDRLVPMGLMRAVDRRLGWFRNMTVFELLT